MSLIACIGDSICYGATSNGVDTPFPTHLAVLQRRPVANHGISGGAYVQNTDIPDKWNQIKAQDIHTLVVQGGVNDLRQSQPATAIWTVMESIIDEAIGLGMQVAVGTVVPWGNYAQWTSARQVETDTLNGFIRAKAGIRVIEWSIDLADSINTEDMYATAGSLDGLHPGEPGTLQMAVSADKRLRSEIIPSTIAPTAVDDANAVLAAQIFS